MGRLNWPDIVQSAFIYLNPFYAPPKNWFQKYLKPLLIAIALVVVLGAAGIGTALSGVASEVYKDLWKTSIKNGSTTIPGWMLVVVVAGSGVLVVSLT
jgi:hypothetical protein